MLLNTIMVETRTYQMLDVVLHRYQLYASEKLEGFPSREYFDEFLSVIIIGELHRLEHDAHYEAEIVFEVFDVLALYLLDDTVHDVKVCDLLRRLRLSRLKSQIKKVRFSLLLTCWMKSVTIFVNSAAASAW